MSSISAGTTSTTTLVHSGDTTGSLVFKTNDTGSGGTTAVTIDTSQRAAFVAGTAALPAITTAGDTNTGIFFPAADTIAFAEGGTEAMRIDSSGNVGIGTTSPTTATDIVRSNTSGNDNQMPNLFVRNTSATQGNGSSTFNQAAVSVSAGNSTVSGGIRAAYDSAGSYGTGVQFYVNSTNPLQFYSNGSERMRIDSSGRLLVGTTSTYNGSCTYQQKTQVDGNQVQSISNSSTNTPYLAYWEYPNVSPNNTGSNFLQCTDSTANRFIVRSNGGLANYQANNVNLSDRREKTNFAPAKSYLNTICSIPVQTFNYIDQNLEDDDGLTLGVVAQDVQAVAPELVMESNWARKDEEPKMRLSIYQTDLQYALMKSIQELKAINDTQAETINALTARVVALESK